jgi:hypothetical protein
MLLKLGEQPAFFQRALSLRPMQRTVEHQCRDFAQGPNHRLDRTSTESLKSRDALVTIDDQKAIALIGHGDDNDRTLLSRSGERGQ